VRNSALIETRVVSPNCNFFRSFIKPAEFVVIHPFSSGDEACGALKDKRKLAPPSRHLCVAWRRLALQSDAPARQGMTIS
jgi:hypothetical protein